MAREELLRAILSARESISSKMREAARGTDELKRSQAETISTSSGLAAVMNTSEESVEDYERAIAELGRESVKTAAKQELVSVAGYHVGESAEVAAQALESYEREVDDAGSEAAEAAAQNLGLAAALKSVAVAAGETSVNIGAFNTSLKRAVIALPAIIGVVGSMATVFLGVAGAATAAAGALGLLFTAGFIGKAEALAESSAEIENRVEAFEEIMSSLGASLAEAIEPIQDLAQQQSAMELLSGLVTIIGDLANSAEELAPLFGAVGDRLDDTFWAEEAKGIAEVENMIRQLMPILEAMTYTVLTQLPDFIAWLTEETREVGPAFGDFLTSLIPLTRELIEITNTILIYLLPALSRVMDIATLLINVFTEVPDPVMAAAGAFFVAATASTAYAGAAILAAGATTLLEAALAPLVAALSTLGGVLSLPAVATAALIAVAVGAIEYFGLWDDITQALIDTWNGFIELIEFTINAVIRLANWLDKLLGPLLLLIPGFGQMMFIIANFNEMLETTTDIIEDVERAWNSFVEDVLRWAEPLMQLIGDVEADVDAAGGVDLSAAQIDQPPGPGANQQQARREASRGGSQFARQRAPEIREERRSTEINVDASGSSMNERDIERIVRRVLEAERQRGSDF